MSHTQAPEITGNVNIFKGSIGNLANDYNKIEIINCHYFKDMSSFHERALRSILQNIAESTWNQCQNEGNWILTWQTTKGDTCSTLPVADETVCTSQQANLDCQSECRNSTSIQKMCECRTCCLDLPKFNEICIKYENLFDVYQCNN